MIHAFAHVVREVIAWIFGTVAVILLVPVVFFFASCYIVDRKTAERYMRGLSGGWARGRRR